MVQHVTTNLVTGMTAINDSGVLKVALPQAGGLASLEITARATNGAGGSASYGILASITKVEVKTLHGQTILDMSATELYRLATLISKEAPQLSEAVGAGVVQIVKLPINFGIGKNGETMGLDLSKYPDCELRISYTLTISGADGFVSKSFNVDVDARQTEDQQPPGYQGRIALSQATQGTTAVQNPDKLNIKKAENIIGVHLYGYKSGTADNALIRNIAMITLPDHKKLVQASFSDLQERSRPIAGSILTSWLTIWLAPGRESANTIQPPRAKEIEIQLEELVADGAVKVFVEELLAY
jgi:hypothetical protein